MSGISLKQFHASEVKRRFADRRIVERFHQFNGELEIFVDSYLDWKEGNKPTDECYAATNYQFQNTVDVLETYNKLLKKYVAFGAIHSTLTPEQKDLVKYSWENINEWIAVFIELYHNL